MRLLRTGPVPEKGSVKQHNDVHEQYSQWLGFSAIESSPVPYRSHPSLPTMPCAMHPQAWVWAPLGLSPAKATELSL